MFYKICRGIANILAHIFYRVKIVRLAPLPEGAAIICCNHTHVFDAIFASIALGPNAKFTAMAKAELFSVPVLGWVCRHLGAFPVKRGQSDITAIKTALRNLKDDKYLLIFPDGRRTFSEEEHANAKAGTGMIALRSGAPVVPMYISPNKRIFSRIDIVVGHPRLETCEGKPDHAAYKAIVDSIMKTILALREEIK